MAYTKDDLARLDAADMALALGQRVTDVQTGDRRVKYAEMPAADRAALRLRMERDVAHAAQAEGRPRLVRAFRGTMGSGY
jgi:hypothetical protein